jgi:hypothetical protein
MRPASPAAPLLASPRPRATQTQAISQTGSQPGVGATGAHGNISRPALLTFPRRQKVLTTAESADEAAAEVLAAFQAARQAGRPPVECYRAGVEAWRRHHPDQAPEYAAKRAVAVILAHNIELKVGE